MVVADIDGPRVIDSVREYVYPYTVDIGDYPSDIQNFTSVSKSIDTSPEVEKQMPKKQGHRFISSTDDKKTMDPFI